MGNRINGEWFRLVLRWPSCKFELFCLTAHNYGSIKYFFIKFGRNVNVSLANKCVYFEEKIYSRDKVTAVLKIARFFLAHPVYIQHRHLIII